MTKDCLGLLISGRMAGKFNSEELEELEEWMEESQVHRELLEHLLSDNALEEELARWATIDPAVGHVKWIRQHKFRGIRVLLINCCAIAAATLIAILVEVC